MTAVRFPVPRYGARANPAQSVGSLPQVVNLVLYEGDDFYLTLTVTDVDGGPVDFSGATAMAQVRTTVSDPSDVAFVPTISGNEIELHLPSTATTGLRSGVWDCQVTYESGDVQTLAHGSVTVTPQVTR
jgi:uncharacterized protein YfaS (alpha-2-macroglobulin family)